VRRAKAKRANGQGSLYREAVNGRVYWTVAVTIPGSGGRRLKRRARSEREARRLLTELLGQAGRGELAPPGRLTLGEWARAWCAEKTPALRASAAHTLEQSLSPLWKPAGEVAPAWAALARLGPVRLSRVTTAAVAGALAECLRAGAGARRVQLLHGHLRACLEAAARRGMLGTNPLRDVPRPRAPERERPAWRLGEVRRFLAVAADPATGERYTAAPFLAFLLCTGMRVSEGLGLTWADLPPEIRTGAGEGGAGGVAWAWVRRAVVWVWGGGATYRVERPKTKSGERAVALSPQAVALLRRRWEALPPEGRRPEARVWARADGEPFSPKLLFRTVRRLCDVAGVPAANVHFLRHAHAALLVGAGLDLQTTRRHLGHARADVTLNIYSYPVRDGAAVATALTRLLAEPGGATRTVAPVARPSG
jgi:integrase